AQIREILISESAWEEMTCLFAPSLMVLFLGLSPAFYGVLMPKTAIACLVIAAAFGIGGWFYGL
ncbi:hypothetical protein, partial [Klebsiella pneumoniae]